MKVQSEVLFESYQFQSHIHIQFMITIFSCKKIANYLKFGTFLKYAYNLCILLHFRMSVEQMVRVLSNENSHLSHCESQSAHFSWRTILNRLCRIFEIEMKEAFLHANNWRKMTEKFSLFEICTGYWCT